MRIAQRAGVLLAAFMCLPIAAAPPACAQDKPAADGKWSDTAEFSYVAIAGNSEATTLGFKNTLGRKWEKSSFELKAGGVRAETTTKTRVAVGPDRNSFSVIEEKDTVLNAENYFLGGRFDHTISGRLFWFAGAGWSRNRFAGVENRYETAGGLGNLWIDTDRTKFRTDYAVSYTKEDDIVQSPNVKDKFAGFRVSSKYEHKLGDSTTFVNDLAIDENLDDTTDLRGNMINSVAVSMSKRLALKVSLQWLYDHQPAFQQIDLLNAPPPVGVKTDTVLDQLDTLDTIFTASLVVNF